MSDTSDRFDPDQAEERLDRLGDDIDQARHDADAHGTAEVVDDDDDDDQRRFVDGGDTGDVWEGQGIAPPA